MKKLTLWALCLALCLGALAAPLAPAAKAADEATVLETIRALGIINGDQYGNLNLPSYVTRAEFAKMMIAGSKYKNTVGSTAASSPFSDVSYTYWAASYIQAAVTAGWLTGFTDGTYRPDDLVTTDEAATAVLKMLGYTTTDFQGAYPQAQMALYYALGLDENISKVQGEYLTREDCMYLFYNLMGTKTTQSAYYAASLGYTVNTSGELDYSSLVEQNMKGPYVASDSGWSSSLPFSAVAVYLNGASADASSIGQYDVYYYNANMRTVWAYRSRVTGVYASATPNTSAPTSITVAGKTYSISTSSAAYALSDLGSYGVGDTVTLLLGRNSDIVAVVAAGSGADTSKLGFVTAVGTGTFTDANGDSYTADTVTVTGTDGVSYTYEYPNENLDKGDLVSVGTSGGKVAITSVSNRYLDGTVNSNGTEIGDYTVASGAEIMDSTSNGSFKTIYASRLAGVTLSSSNVRYYETNDAGEISLLILNDATGDAYSYGVLTSVNENNSGMSTSGTYRYVINGTSGTFSGSTVFSVKEDTPALFEFSGSSIVKLKNLTKVAVTSLSSSYATASGTKFRMAEDASVYVYDSSSGNYYLSSVSAVSDTTAYTLTAWYDKLPSSGGRVRVVIAEAKS